MDRHSVQERIREQQEYAREIARKHARSRKTIEIDTEIRRLERETEEAERGLEAAKQRFEHFRSLLREARDRFDEHSRNFPRGIRPHARDYSNPKDWWRIDNPGVDWMLDDDLEYKTPIVDESPYTKRRA